MDVIALVGPSGTGKSHRALVVAHEQGADTIIDDGLLIKDCKIIAGHSAKKEDSKIKAVRRAIFTEQDHTDEVKEAILQVMPSKILILGTSENMVQKIVAALNLPAISKVIHIEDIASSAEIAKARESRLKEGKHIIPVPTIELKPHFSGYMIDPLEIFFRKPQAKRHKLGEKSIVRPTFSYYGKLLISDAAISAIVEHMAMNEPNITRVNQINIKNSQVREKGISISVEVTAKYGSMLRKVAQETQMQIKQSVEYMTGMTVKVINVTIKRLSMN